MDQFVDRTTKRQQTYYDGTENGLPGICHIAMHTPFCEETRKVCTLGKYYSCLACVKGHRTTKGQQTYYDGTEIGLPGICHIATLTWFCEETRKVCTLGKYYSCLASVKDHRTTKGQQTYYDGTEIGLPGICHTATLTWFCEEIGRYVWYCQGSIKTGVGWRKIINIVKYFFSSNNISLIRHSSIGAIAATPLRQPVLLLIRP